MFAPIRPSPMNPICIASSSAERAADGLLEGRQVGGEVGPEMDVDDGSVAGPEGLAIAVGLGIDEPAEGVGPAGDLAIRRVVRGQLQEDARRWAALVELPRRMEEA